MRHPELGLHYVSGALRHGPAPSAWNIDALTTRPRRLLEGDALALSALEIITHFDPLMWIVENPATGLLKTRPFMERLPWVDVTYCKYGNPYRKSVQAEPVQARQPLRGVAGRQAPPGRAAGAAADGGAVREGQNHASWSTAFLPRCARRLRARPRRSLRSG